MTLKTKESTTNVQEPIIVIRTWIFISLSVSILFGWFQLLPLMLKLYR